MPKEETLNRLDKDIEQGDLSRARDRLHGLIHTYPDDISLRARLGEVYHSLQHPQMAGRYWYLEDNQTDAMRAAVSEFEKSVGRSAAQILVSLRFRGSLDEIPDHAREKLTALQTEAWGSEGGYPVFGPRARPEWKRPPGYNSFWKSFPWGWLVYQVAKLIVLVIGIITIVKWIL